MDAATTNNAGEDSPHLDEREQRQAAERAPLGPLVIHEIVREQGEAELTRPSIDLAWSSLASGLSIGFSMLAQANIAAGLPDARWSPLVASFGYSLGFLIVILGQQQLFTETTLTGVIPVLYRRDMRTLLSMLRVWAIVLTANLVGTWIFAAGASVDLFLPGVAAAMDHLGASMLSHSFGHVVAGGVAAGWLIGLTVWLLPGAGPARPLIIILLTYVIAVCGFPHIVAGSVETARLVLTGDASLGAYLLGFLMPTALGNVVGGTILAALLNHAPLAGELGSSLRPER